MSAVGILYCVNKAADLGRESVFRLAIGLNLKALVLAVLAACLLSACTDTATHANSPDVREVFFSCGNGESVAVRFFPAQGVAVLVRDGQTIELQQQPSGSGFIYSNGPNTIRGKGDDLTVEIGRMVPVQCKAR